MPKPVEIYEGQRAYWARNEALVGPDYYERELMRAFSMADHDPDQAIGSLAVLCAGLLEALRETDPAHTVEKGRQ